MPEHDRNLDYIAARYAQEIVKEAASAETLERLATKALAVLQAQGVYGGQAQVEPGRRKPGE